MIKIIKLVIRILSIMFILALFYIFGIALYNTEINLPYILFCAIVYIIALFIGMIIAILIDWAWNK